jgi:hypothetical protein
VFTNQMIFFWKINDFMHKSDIFFRKINNLYENKINFHLEINFMCYLLIFFQKRANYTTRFFLLEDNNNNIRLYANHIISHWKLNNFTTQSILTVKD